MNAQEAKELAQRVARRKDEENEARAIQWMPWIKHNVEIAVSNGKREVSIERGWLMARKTDAQVFRAAARILTAQGFACSLDDDPVILFVRW